MHSANIAEYQSKVICIQISFAASYIGNRTLLLSHDAIFLKEVQQFSTKCILVSWLVNEVQ